MLKSAGPAKDENGNILLKNGRQVELFFDEDSPYWEIQKDIQALEKAEKKSRQGRKSARRL